MMSLHLIGLLVVLVAASGAGPAPTQLAQSEPQAAETASGDEAAVLRRLDEIEADPEVLARAAEEMKLPAGGP